MQRCEHHSRHCQHRRSDHWWTVSYLPRKYVVLVLAIKEVGDVEPEQRPQYVKCFLMEVAAGQDQREINGQIPVPVVRVGPQRQGAFSVNEDVSENVVADVAWEIEDAP